MDSHRLIQLILVTLVASIEAQPPSPEYFYYPQYPPAPSPYEQPQAAHPSYASAYQPAYPSANLATQPPNYQTPIYYQPIYYPGPQPAVKSSYPAVHPTVETPKHQPLVHPQPVNPIIPPVKKQACIAGNVNCAQLCTVERSMVVPND